MGYALDFKHPLLPTDRGLNDLVLKHVRVVSAVVAASAELGELLNVIIGLISTLHHVSNICVALHVITIVIVIVHVVATTVILDHGFLKLEFVLHGHLAEALQECANTLSVTGLELARRHVELNADLFDLKDHVLGGSRRVVVLVPPRDLLAINF